MPLDQTAGDSGGGRALLGGYEDAQAVMATATHSPTPGIDHETDQEAIMKGIQRKVKQTQKER